MRKLFSKTAAILLCLSIAFGTFLAASASDGSGNYIDNSDVMPLYVSDEYVNLEKSDEDGELMTPSWFKTAIIVQVRLDNASTDGTLEGCMDMLDHYSETGINCLWVCPIAARCTTPSGGKTNFYTNAGPHTIDPELTGTEDYDEGWERFAWFVRQAHRRNIRIIVDFTIWGCSEYAELVDEHPEYFGHNEDGSLADSGWGGPAYDYNGEAFRSWYKGVIKDIVKKTDIDGLRLDLEPAKTGYDFWKEIRNELYASGNKIVMMSEAPNERQGTYDCAQTDVSDYKNGWSYARQMLETDHNYYLDYYSPVESVKTGQCIGTQLSQGLEESGTDRFYTYMLSCHDDGSSNINQNLLVVGYQAIFTPFIPIWCMGEELGIKTYGQLYENARVDCSVLSNESNRYFYETLKKYIRIRRTYTDIFEYYPTNHRESNICEVQVAGLQKYQAYARYDKNGNAVIIVPNGNTTDRDAKMSVYIPYEDIGAEKSTNVKITDLMTGKVIGQGSTKDNLMFEADVKYNELGVYLVETTGVKKAVYSVKEVGDGSADTVTETTVENPVDKTRTVTKTVNVTEPDWLSPAFWIALSCCCGAVVVAGVLLTVFFVRRRKRGMK